MKVEVELHSKMSRSETFRALQIVLSAAARLAHRMTDAELQKVENFGAALTAVARDQKRHWAERELENRTGAGATA